MRSRWMMLAVLFLARSMIGFQFQSLTSVGVDVMRDLGLSAMDFGALVGIYVLPGLVLALPGGLVSDRFPPKWMGVGALCVMTLGSVVMAVGASLTWLYIGRLLGGSGYALLTVVVARMVPQRFFGGDLVRANGIVLASWPAGLALGVLVQPALAAVFGWRDMLAVTGATCLAMAVLLAALYRSPLRSSTSARTSRAEAVPYRWETVAVIIAGIAWGGFNLALVIFFSFGPRQLAQYDVASPDAGVIMASGLWVGAISTVFGGYLAERIGRPMLVVGASCALGAAGLSAFAAGNHLVLASIALGASIGPAAAVMMSLPVEASRAATVGTSFGIFYAVFFIMVGFGPMAAGAVEELAHSVGAAVWSGAVLMIASALTVRAYYAVYRYRLSAR